MPRLSQADRAKIQALRDKLAAPAPARPVTEAEVGEAFEAMRYALERIAAVASPNSYIAKPGLAGVRLTFEEKSDAS
jgi:hypothetical protein